MRWWILDLYQAGLVVVLLCHIFWVLFSISLHELGHGWAAIRQGDDTPIVYQRMSLNPAVHIPPFAWLMFAILGITWGLMPVDPSKFKARRRGRAIVAAAGPAINLGLAIVCIVGVAVWVRFVPVADSWYEYGITFLFVGAQLNLLLLVFNLLPIPPLDGAEILRGLSFRMWKLFGHEHASILGMLLVMAIIMSGLSDFLWYGSYHSVIAFADVVSDGLGGPPLAPAIPFGY